MTPTGVRVVRCDNLQLVHEYVAPRTVTVAVGNIDQIVLALTGGEIIFLEVDSKVMSLVQISSTSLDQDIACLSLWASASQSNSNDEMNIDITHTDESTDESKGKDQIKNKNTILAVGLWTDNSVRLFALQTLQELTRTQLGVDTQAQARDVILVALGDILSPTVYLIVGLGDGTLITFIVDFLDGLPNLTARRKVVLGTHPISLTAFSHAGLPCVFASCDRPTVLSTLNGKLIFSVVNISEKTCMAPFHSELFPDCLALSSEVGLMIGIVDEIQRLHVQSHPLGESPRRIAHSGQSGVYAGNLQKKNSDIQEFMNLVIVAFPLLVFTIKITLLFCLHATFFTHILILIFT